MHKIILFSIIYIAFCRKQNELDVVIYLFVGVL